jgi:hypothetical protein
MSPDSVFSVTLLEGKGHRLDSRQRESSINQLLTTESKLLRCPQIEENARHAQDSGVFCRERGRIGLVGGEGGFEPPVPYLRSVTDQRSPSVNHSAPPGVSGLFPARTTFGKRPAEASRTRRSFLWRYPAGFAQANLAQPRREFQTRSPSSGD